MALMRQITFYWRSLALILVPLALSPLIVAAPPSDDPADASVFKCLYVMLLMALFWVLELLPLPVTSLLPIAILPVLGVMQTGDVIVNYLKDSSMLALSGLLIAISVEHSNLHRRIALNALNIAGTSERRLMLGFMMPTAFLSMWISNTATTAMMVPIVQVLIDELEGTDDLVRNVVTVPADVVDGAEHVESTASSSSKKTSRLRNMVFLSVAYSATVGGTGTLTGTGPNIVFAGFADQVSNGKSGINFASWMIYSTPVMITCLITVWIFLQIRYLGLPFISKSSEDSATQKRRQTNAEAMIRKQLENLGPMTFHEWSVLILFIFLILTWFTRDPQIFPGWIDLFSVSETSYIKTNISCISNCTYYSITENVPAVSNASPGVLVVLLLFILPSSLNFLTKNEDFERVPSLLDWKVVHEKMPWGLIFLWGGGFALAKATQVSNLSNWLGMQLEVLDFLDQRMLVLVVCTMAAAITEVASNTATVSILMPVLNDLAMSLKVNPLYLLLPVTQATSYAFMVPVATAPNTIVYAASGMPISEMAKTGFGLNLLCLAINFLFINTYGVAMFDLNNFPDWANSTLTSN